MQKHASDVLCHARYTLKRSKGLYHSRSMLSIGVARYTDVTVRYVPRFGGHGSIPIRNNRKKKEIYYARFLFIYFEQTVVQIKNKSI